MSSQIPDPTDGGTASERGVQYPADSLRDAVSMLETVRDAVGLAPATRELIASALGYSSMSGRVARKIGSLAHFGLIDRSGKGAARISELGKSILMPTSEAERRTAMVEAVKTPRLFSALLARYTGHALPSLLPNLLAREHGVNPSVAATAAATFRDSVEFAGLLRNGVLHADPVAEAEGSAEGLDQKSESATDSLRPATTNADAPNQQERSSTSNPAIDSALGTFTIPLDRSGRVATISMPLPLSDRDLLKVGAWVTYMRATIADDEKAPDISSN